MNAQTPIITDRAVAAPVAPALHTLISAERHAYARFDQACRGSRPDEDEEAWEAASAAQSAAYGAVLAADPTTWAEVDAMIQLFIDRDLEVVSSPVDDHLSTLFEAIRAFGRHQSRALVRSA